MIEYIKVFVSVLTPVAILYVGRQIQKNLEKSKIDFIKEKEWQVHWADRFIKTAYELNTNISSFVCTLFELQRDKNEIDIDELSRKLNEYREIILLQEWDIKNYVQFAPESRKEVLDPLSEIMDGFKNIVKNKKGDIEPIRQNQFEFNKAVRKAHAEILSIKKIKNIEFKQ